MTLETLLEKRWWARVGEGYGRWVPTGCSDKEEARAYLEVYYGYRSLIQEWLLL